jgi:hypothetical protein
MTRPLAAGDRNFTEEPTLRPVKRTGPGNTNHRSCRNSFPARFGLERASGHRMTALAMR